MPDWTQVELKLCDLWQSIVVVVQNDFSLVQICLLCFNLSIMLMG